MLRNLLFAVAGICLAAGPAAAAESAALLGVFDNWSAYSAGDGASKTCYILSKPRASQPRGAKRGPIFLMVSDWPGRKVKAEPQIVYGYPTKEGGTGASLGIGSDKFIAVTYTSDDDQTGLALYAQSAGGGWEGVWTYTGSRDIGTENWTAK